MTHQRTNHLMAQKVDVGIIFLDMLGEADGVAYLQHVGVPAHVIERVTHHPNQRRKHAAVPAKPGASNDSPGSTIGSQNRACRRG